jgi:hypothetical protein
MAISTGYDLKLYKTLTTESLSCWSPLKDVKMIRKMKPRLQ